MTKKIIAGIVLALMVFALPVGLVGCKKKANKDPLYGTVWKAEVTADEDSALTVEVDTASVARAYLLEQEVTEDFDGQYEYLKSALDQGLADMPGYIAEEMGGEISLYVIDNKNAYIWMINGDTQFPIASMDFSSKGNSKYEIKFKEVDTKAEVRAAYEARNIEVDADVVGEYPETVSTPSSEVSLTASVDFKKGEMFVDLTEYIKKIFKEEMGASSTTNAVVFNDEIAEAGENMQQTVMNLLIDNMTVTLKLNKN